MNKDFKASRDLSPEDFQSFSRQCINEFTNMRIRLAYARREAVRHEADAQYYAKRINTLKADAMRHGLEFPE